MKKFKLIIFSLVVLLGMVIINSNTLFASGTNNEDTVTSSYDIEKVNREIFGDIKIKSSEYLYNLDGSADFVYINFEDYGYAVYLAETYEMLEYAPQGNLPYPNTKEKKYYCGPNNYLTKVSGQFEDKQTGETFLVPDVVAKNYSKEVRENFLNRNKKQFEQNKDMIEERNHTMDFGVSATKTASTMNLFRSNYSKNIPSIDDNPLIIGNPPGSTGTTHIPNAQYFLNNPMHGNNSTGTCGAVAAQLLLSYNNFYNDRRIIADNFLNGGNTPQTERNRHPNFSEDPMSMTRDTLGSRGLSEDGSDDENSYFAQVVNAIPASANLADARNGIRNILNTRSNQIEGNIDFELDSGNTLGLWPIDTENIKKEINAGRPLIIGMHRWLDGWDHWVVGYGYQNYTYPGTNDTYFGYITHFGHSGNTAFRTNIWINSSWCDSYISLRINHTHNYSIDTENNIGNDKREVRCDECGHRNIDDLYNVLESTILNARYPLSGSITIPSVINGTTITTIGNGAFNYQNQMTQISIPSSVTKIGTSAFANCTNLTSITLPFIGNELNGTSNTDFKYIFGNTIPSSLKTVTITGGNSIKPEAFYGCGSLITITLPNTVTSIGDNAFIYCSRLINITIPNSVTSIGGGAFSYCTSLTSISIPSNVTRIDSYAFGRCSNLASVTIPDSLTNIGGSLFSDCPKLDGYVVSVNSRDHRVINYSGDLNWSNHTYNSNYICTVCGYEHTLHTYVTLGSPSHHHEDCTLCHTKIYCSGEATLINQTPYDHDYFCYTCSKQIKQAHTYLDGSCTVCHYQHDHVYYDNYYLETQNAHYQECFVCGYHNYCISTITITSRNQAEHTWSCSHCSYTKVERHEFNSNQICTICGYNSSHSCSYGHHYDYYSSTKHKSCCSCGKYVLEWHLGYAPIDPSEPMYCGSCGYEMRLGIPYALISPNGATYVSLVPLTNEIFLELVDIPIAHNNYKQSEFYLPPKNYELDEFLS